MATARGHTFAVNSSEVSGALGDLGTLLPITLGAIAVMGLSPAPVILGFAVFYLATALYYRLPIPVQPMKVVAAVMLTAGLTPAGLAASGVMIGVALIVLGCTGWINSVGRLIPQSVLSGLQFGLGIVLALMSLDLMASAPFVGGVTLMAVLGCLLVPRYPAALVGLAVAAALAWSLGAPGIQVATVASGWISVPSVPSLMELERALSTLVLPQLPLTLTNAAVLTALLAGSYYGDRAAHVTPARLSLSSGFANVFLTPLGAIPMCHGAGGLAAHHRFGARTGTAPLLIGLGLILFLLLPYSAGAAILVAIPLAGLGALLMVAAGELALTRRLFDCKPSCWPVIAITAGLTVWLDPFWALVGGSVAEAMRALIVRRLVKKAGA